MIQYRLCGEPMNHKYMDYQHIEFDSYRDVRAVVDKMADFADKMGGVSTSVMSVLLCMTDEGSSADVGYTKQDIEDAKIKRGRTTWVLEFNTEPNYLNDVAVLLNTQWLLDNWTTPGLVYGTYIWH